MFKDFSKQQSIRQELTICGGMKKIVSEEKLMLDVNSSPDAVE